MRYLKDYEMQNYQIVRGFDHTISTDRSDLANVFNNVDLEAAVSLKFDIGIRGKTAEISGDIVIDDAPTQKVHIDLPSTAFTKSRPRYILQIRFDGGSGEQIIGNLFLDVVDSVTPLSS